MTDKDSAATGGEPNPDPQSRIEAEESDREGWFDRLKSAIGLRSQASLRADLEEALAGEDLAESFTQGERAMLRNLLRLGQVRVDDLMVPRADIHAVEHDIRLGDLLQEFRESGHSRMPVYRSTLDDPIGMIHIKDVMGHVTKLADAQPGDADAGASPLDLAKVDLARPLCELGLTRNVLFVPPSMPATSLLASMQARRIQMALVVDEYGGTDGVVSMEDIVEAVFGEIDDEHDDIEGPMVVAEADGTYVADARADLEEVAALIGNGFGGDKNADVDTVGGLIFNLIGRVPVRGELIAAPGGYEMEILDADPRRIKRLRIRRRVPGEARAEVRRRPRPSPEAPTGA